ncbi:hypothetical protein MGYG_05291 [Nannizzia gypsea CBS 118893]|uniref:Uncharacterized protein n=1 Tax=Arthroderma gypseum (strain ATCC MYA-4604 / CBS 118893) TaxID=535722 RepID=E4UVG6_ARTGP|nr:hypothetical protein MGYG_05291 [Nannizzia gypsea CBS 118893]EFR02293.1 hypothetical protein MGYG_05291 [Nannizzia gypsea CBS 118893]
MRLALMLCSLASKPRHPGYLVRDLTSSPATILGNPAPSSKSGTYGKFVVCSSQTDEVSGLISPNHPHSPMSSQLRPEEARILSPVTVQHRPPRTREMSHLRRSCVPYFPSTSVNEGEDAKYTEKEAKEVEMHRQKSKGGVPFLKHSPLGGDDRHPCSATPLNCARSAVYGLRGGFLHWLIRGMAGRLDAESNDFDAQITDYKSTEDEEAVLARYDWRGPQNLHASYSFVLPEGSDFEDETRVGQDPTHGKTKSKSEEYFGNPADSTQQQHGRVHDYGTCLVLLVPNSRPYRQNPLLAR